MEILHLVLWCVLVAVVAGEGFQLLLLHNNDMHGRFEETSRSCGTCKTDQKNKTCFGGFARLAHVIRGARAEAASGNGPPVLYLNAGDTYTGTAWFTVHKWRIAADFLNRLEPDAISLGNHEFDFSVEGLVPFAENFRYPLLAANLNFSQEPLIRDKIQKSVVLDVKGRKVGVIGYLTPETKNVAIGVEKIQFLDEVKAIKEESERLDAQGVKIIIALGHSGFDTDKSIAKNVPLVDVVIGGHTNTFLWTGKQPDVEVPEGPYPTVIQQASGKKVPVIEAYAYTKYLGRLLTTFDEQGNLVEYTGKPILLTHDIPQDRDVLDLLETYRPQVDALMKKVVGNTRVNLDITGCRERECNFGNFVTDAMIANKVVNYGGHYWTDAPIALVNGGSLRMSIDRGELTAGDFLGAMPFDLRIISFSLNGSDVLKMLETSVRSNGETSRGEFLQVSGLKIIYDLSKPSGKRVVEVKTRCALCNVPTYNILDPKKTYRLITNSYILEGGDKYTVLKEKSFNHHQEDLNDLDMTVWYLEKNKIVYPEEGGRIEYLKDTYRQKHSSGNGLVHSLGLTLTCLLVAVHFK